jgi:RNA polymerase sigma-70 factor, ECF subfamily
VSSSAALEAPDDRLLRPFARGLSAAEDDDEALLEGLRAGHPSAVAAFCDQYSAHVLRVLARILGRDGDLADLHHDVFIRALRSLREVRGASSLKGWITIIAVNVARSRIAQRSRQRWLCLLPWYEVPEVEAAAASEDDVDALRRTYALLDRLPAPERIAFTLRIIDGMELTEVARACGTSLATIKRRLKHAEERFKKMAQSDPLLAPWIEGGARWSGIR